MVKTRTSSTAIRLGITGDPEVKRKLEDIGQTGDAAAQRMAKSFIKAESEVEAAMARRERQMAKLNAIMPQTAMQMQVDGAAGTGFGQYEGSARRSASVFAEMLAQQEQMERRAHALTAALDPLYAAQSRYDAELREANALLAAGAISHEIYQKKLQVETAELDRVAQAQGRAGVQSGAMRQAMAGASYQVQDFFTQVSMGANPVNALVVQGGQLAGQFQNVGGKAGAVASFFMGGWGLAIQVALFALGPLVSKLMEGSKASEELRNKVNSLTDALSKEKFGTEQATKAIREYNDAKAKAADTDSLAVEQSLRLAEARLKEALALRETIKAQIDKALVDEGAARGLGGGELLAVAAAGGGALDAQEERIKLLNETLANLYVDKSAQAEKLVDRVAAINNQYDRQRDAAIRAARGNVELSKALSGTRQEIERNRQAALKAEQERKQAANDTKRDAETLTSSQVAKMLRGDLPGVQITSTTGGKHVKNSYHYRNQAVDFVPAGGMSSMTKADVRQLFESRGIEIVELLGPGDKNHSDHFHVAWTKGKLSLDAFTDAAKRAKEEAEELTSLRLFTGGNVLGQSLVGVRQAITAQREDFNNAARNIFASDFGDDAIGKIVGEHDQRQRVEVDRWNEENARRLDKQEEDFRYLGNLWSTVFSGGTKGVWDMFRQQGLQVISELLARWMAFGNVKGAGGAAGGFLDAIGTLFGGGTTAMPDMTKTNAMLDQIIIPRFASGTAYAPGGWADVGEFGKERVWLPRGSAVSSARDTRRMAGNDNSVPVQNHYHIAPGNLLTPEFWDMIHAGNEMAAARGAAGGAELSKMQNARATRRRITR